MYFKVLSIGVALFALASCTGNNNDAYQQQQVPVATAEQQPAQTAPVDSTMAQAQDPAQAQAQPAAAAAQSLPDGITSFIKQNFPNASIVGVEPDNEHGGLEYDVYLNDGTELDFDTNHQWETIDCHTKAVPAAFVPKGIASYVKSNNQGLPITKICRKPYGYEIELNNGLELRFDPNGNFAGIDD